MSKVWERMSLQGKGWILTLALAIALIAIYMSFRTFVIWLNYHDYQLQRQAVCRELQVNTFEVLQIACDPFGSH